MYAVKEKKLESQKKGDVQKKRVPVNIKDGIIQLQNSSDIIPTLAQNKPNTPNQYQEMNRELKLDSDPSDDGSTFGVELEVVFPKGMGMSHAIHEAKNKELIPNSTEDMVVDFTKGMNNEDSWNPNLISNQHFPIINWTRTNRRVPKNSIPNIISSIKMDVHNLCHIFNIHKLIISKIFPINCESTKSGMTTILPLAQLLEKPTLDQIMANEKMEPPLSSIQPIPLSPPPPPPQGTEMFTLTASIETVSTNVDNTALSIKTAKSANLITSDINSKDYMISIKTEAEKWNPLNDTTVTGDDLFGLEWVSPILHFKTQDWKQIDDICNIIKSNNGCINDSCSEHIHVGNQILKTASSYDSLFRLYITFCDEIDIFARNRFQADSGGPKLRAKIEDYASVPISKNLKERQNTPFYTPANVKDPVVAGIYQYEFGKDPRDYNQRTQALNITQNYNSEREKTTVEFRRFNGTIDSNIIQANILLTNALMRTAQTKSIEEIESTIGVASKLSGKNKLACFIDLIALTDEEKNILIAAYLANLNREEREDVSAN